MINIATVFSGIGAPEHALIRMNQPHKIIFACDNGEIDIFRPKLKRTPEGIRSGFEMLEKEADSTCVTPELSEKIRNLRKEYESLNSGQLTDKMLRYFQNEISEIIGNIRTEKAYSDFQNIQSYAEQKKFVDDLYKGKEKFNKVRTSYLANYDLDPADFHWNVKFLDGTRYRDQVDLFVGGSPCQSFSMVGKQRGLEDTRGTLFYEYIRLINEIQPKVFIYENVKAVLSNNKKQTWEIMEACFKETGYKWKYAVLNAKDYGIPQNRERLFVVGIREDVLRSEFEFPEKIELTHTMQDYLESSFSGKYLLPDKGNDFVTSEEKLSKRYTQINGDIALCQKKNQQFNWHGDFWFIDVENLEEAVPDLSKYVLSEKVEKYVRSPGTKNFHCRPETDLPVARPVLSTLYKSHRAGVDNYVTVASGHLRKLTPRECLRLMGFRDTFKIVVSDTAAYQQAGNSIVVNVLMAIFESVFKSTDLDAVHPESELTDADNPEYSTL